jgi:hypothetical protein
MRSLRLCVRAREKRKTKPQKSVMSEYQYQHQEHQRPRSRSLEHAANGSSSRLQCECVRWAEVSRVTIWRDLDVELPPDANSMPEAVLVSKAGIQYDKLPLQMIPAEKYGLLANHVPPQQSLPPPPMPLAMQMPPQQLVCSESSS